jgi:hypothetical protein
MKKKLNIICLLVIVVFVAGIITDIKDSKNAFIEGFNDSIAHESQNMMTNKKGHPDMDKEKREEPLGYAYEFKIPVSHNSMRDDSVVNARTNQKVPFFTDKAMVFINKKNGVAEFFDGMFVFVYCFAYVWSLAFFVRFIRNVRRGVIFDHRNVKQLRMIGWGLLVVFFSNFVTSVASFYALSQVFEMRNVEIQPSDIFATTEIVLSLMAFLFAEVFSLGIKMREEQELTI